MKIGYIYAIEFPDADRTYIGQTIRSLKSRLQMHMGKQTNKELYDRLTRGETYDARIVHTCPDDKLNAYEDTYIFSLRPDRRINVMWSNGSPINPVPNLEGNGGGHKGGYWKVRKNQPINKTRSYTCSVCHVTKTWEHYYRDKSRFSGLYSRCIECMTYAKDSFVRDANGRRVRVDPSPGMSYKGHRWDPDLYQEKLAWLRRKWQQNKYSSGELPRP